MTSDTSEGETSARLNASLMATDPSSWAARDDNAPLNDPEIDEHHKQ